MRTDFKMKNLIGRGSGESIQMAFSGQGWVLVQPSEGRVEASAGSVQRRLGRCSTVDDELVVVLGVVDDDLAGRAPPARLQRRCRRRSCRYGSPPPLRAPQSASSRSAPASSRPDSVSSYAKRGGRSE